MTDNDYAQGLDISQWQATNFPWQRAAEQGFSFAYIRASVRCKPDPFYTEHRTRAGAAGLLTGSYHYLYPTPKPEAQALAFFSAIAHPSHHTDQLSPALDVEENELSEAHILEFIATFKKLTQDAPLAIYTSQRKWYNTVGQDAQWPASYPLWIADWRGREEPAVPCPWQHWTFWQFTSKARIPGHTGPVDLNYYNGTRADLLEDYPELWT